ncbi:conserved hypothetical protein [Desulfosarcina cetonica]|uniref:hypothetical protein n=1 Tax=Desulfosarcina cetonica TaxID=90730 RepID=UPI0006D04396|nr:hypothetical protein [Desulfosarcina cetonica]VTR65408.1 conserved hypothetical protein [Desulfosarcina cetonica]
MPLTNFGAILNFAETLEQTDMTFYEAAAAAVPDAPRKALYTTLAKENKKNVSLVQRTRRENVTEMILEPIQDFERTRYQVPTADAVHMDPTAILPAALSREARAIRYYTDAAEKIRALPEVSRALTSLAKKRGRRLAQLNSQ